MHLILILVAAAFLWGRVSLWIWLASLLIWLAIEIRFDRLSDRIASAQKDLREIIACLNRELGAEDKRLPGVTERERGDVGS